MSSNSQWAKWISEPGKIRVVAVEALALVKELCVQQKLEGIARTGYSEAVIGSLLIASAHKSNESINMNAQGSGVYKQAIIDASPEGRVRGFLIEETNTAKHTYGAEGHNGPWGSGVLSILYTKNFEGKHPYTGMVPISTGFLDEAINSYYSDSEQLASQLGLHVEVDKDGKILAASGALIQALGGASEEEVADIRAINVKLMRELAKHATKLELFAEQAGALLKDRTLRLVESKPLIAFCNCSQERIERAIMLTGEEDAMDALDTDPFLTIICDFCRKEYRVSRERLKDLFSRDPSRLQ